MPRELYIKAYPKINITLKIQTQDSTSQTQNTREPSLHKLSSRFCLALGELYDIMYFTLCSENALHDKQDSKIPLFREQTPLHTQRQLVLQGNFDCEIESNLIYKAYKILLQTAKQQVTCPSDNDSKQHVISDLTTSKESLLFVKVLKNIPTGSGLGGGSVNAAISLIAMNTLLNLGLNVDSVLQCAQALGSDVPFFVVLYLQGEQNLHTFFLSNPKEYALSFLAKTSEQNVSPNPLNAYYAAASQAQTESHIRTQTYNIESNVAQSLSFCSANVFGTGEVIIPFYEKPICLILHCNSIACHTGKVYAMFDKLQTETTESKRYSAHSKHYSTQQNIDLTKDSKTLLLTHSIFELNDLYKPASMIYPLESMRHVLTEKYGKVFFSGSGSTFFSLKQSQETTYHRETFYYARD
ncbi:hypothetical protein CQA66_02370 [Helicobacter aurati]|uniref:GHMP kinase N-terminal domain-containing protein n=1 Tax=Helicobacter aurati TaxID=137778 RepID=A0A3D8J6I5_9HELI|nr:hypothetical protein [Helicobacter aurati]RDU73093.1 hypothetical protein CQA66_02370 [Helicobacter aurati]